MASRQEIYAGPRGEHLNINQKGSEEGEGENKKQDMSQGRTVQRVKASSQHKKYAPKGDASVYTTPRSWASGKINSLRT